MLLVAVGLIEEDARFGLLFEAVQGVRRPTVGLLHGWWREPLDSDSVREHTRRLRELGLVQVVNPEAPRLDWALQVPEVVWDALRSGFTSAESVRHRRLESLPREDDLILPQALRATLARARPLLGTLQVRTLIIRGPRHTGRHTIAAMLARSLGRGSWRWRRAPAATGSWRRRWPRLDALPLVTLDVPVGESVELPSPSAYQTSLLVVMGRAGGVRGPGADDSLVVHVGIPAPEERQRHWRESLGGAGDSVELGERLRLGVGAIRRLARLGLMQARLEGRERVTAEDVVAAGRTLRPAALDTLATRLVTHGDWSQLAVAPEVRAELQNLELRCRHRERIFGRVSAALEAQLNSGVRALFTGPSGTGKTLAARLLASILRKDLYRIDLSAIVNKYIGETEKNLNQVFALAEELDVVLLFDEGDALMTQRTSVNNANDRYANLETNYLLQRIESYDGILIVTTNAAESIDSAFQRRMDQVVDFRRPEPAERWAIWQIHLPAEHTVDEPFLRELASRCALSGGQIRNAVLHATLLALDENAPLGSAQVESAVQREYRKSGGVCPLRRARG